jgi:hypothetical protein
MTEDREHNEQANRNMVQVIQLVGAAFLLGAFVANQSGWLGPDDLSYLLINFLGAAILTYVALVTKNWGFLILEGVWTFWSLWAMIQVLF